MTRKAVVAFLAAVALGVGVFLSSSALAANSGRCDTGTSCADEISATCGPNPTGSCIKTITDPCKASLCTCTGEAGLPTCPVTTTSTSTTTTTTTSTPGIQCCIRNPACEPAFTCQILSAGECSTAGGVNVGPGTCAGFPCPTTTTPPSACCTQSTPGGPFDQCSIQGLCQCGLLGGVFHVFQSCTPNPCATTTSTTTSSTSSTTTSSPLGTTTSTTTSSTTSTTTSTTTSSTITSTTTSTSWTCSTSTTSSTTSTTTWTTTTTTTPPTQCCVQSSPMGAFDICLLETPAQCAAQGGIDHGSGTCSPNPCLPGCFQPGPDCVSCGTCGNGLCAWNGSNTCGTHHGPNPVCINPSDCSGGACSAATGDASCPPGQACVLVGGSGPICCAGCF